MRGANNETNIMFTNNTMVNKRFKQVLQIIYYVISIVRKWSLWMYFCLGITLIIFLKKLRIYLKKSPTTHDVVRGR